MMWGTGTFAGLMMFLFWGMIIAGLVLVVRGYSDRRSGTEKTALGILRERYAKGEISPEDFQRMRDELHG
ncbi:MAG: SHOCT domain-containing protein [Firmicutes bacterium]|nr:SHOCT domain-containing protein [Bacillota bacterium]